MRKVFNFRIIQQPRDILYFPASFLLEVIKDRSNFILLLLRVPS